MFHFFFFLTRSLDQDDLSSFSLVLPSLYRFSPLPPQQSHVYLLQKYLMGSTTEPTKSTLNTEYLSPTAATRSNGERDLSRWWEMPLFSVQPQIT